MSKPATLHDAGILSKGEPARQPFEELRREVSGPAAKAGTVAVNVRVPPDLHRKLKDMAYRESVSMQQLVTSALERLVE